MPGLVATTDPRGALGGLVVERLRRRGLPQRLVLAGPTDASTPEDPPDPGWPSGAETRRCGGYADRAGMAAALDGVETLFLVPLKERPDRPELHAAVVDAAVSAGVERVVYLSFLGASAASTFTLARHHHLTEEHVRRSGLAFTVLRGSAFLEVVHWLIGEDAVIRGPGGAGRFAPVGRPDVADVVAEVVAADGRHDGRTYDLTGPEALSLVEIAELFSQASGSRVRYVDEALDEAWAWRRRSGAADWLVEAWVTTYLQIARGELDVVSDVVPRLTGHLALSLAEYLRGHPEDYAGLG